MTDSPARLDPSPPARTKRRQVARFVVRALKVGVALLVAVSPFIWWSYIHDESPADDADLLVSTPAIPDGQNGYVQLTRLPAKSLSPIDYVGEDGHAEVLGDYAGGPDNDDIKLVDAFLAQARPALVPLDDILASPYFHYVGNESVFYDRNTRSISFATEDLARSAMRYEQGGNLSGAVDEVVRLRLLASRLAETGGPAYNLAREAGFLADDRSASLLNERALTAAAQSTLAQAYGVEIPWLQARQQILPYQYQQFIGLINFLKSSPWTAFDLERGFTTSLHGMNALDFWTKVTLKENTTRRLAAPMIRAAREALNGPYAAIPPDTDSFPHRLMDLLEPNFGGAYLMDMSVAFSASRQSLGFAYEDLASDRLIQTGLAVRRYFDEHRALPPALDALVPQFASAVPLDPFDDKPLRYDATQGLLYSMGASLKDQGGSDLIRRPPDPSRGESPLGDHNQPTLVLKFQNALPVSTATTPP